MAAMDILLWPLAGGALGAGLGYAIAVLRRDLSLIPIQFAISAGVVALATSMAVSGAETICFIAALSVLALTDLKLRILPNELTYGLVVAGVIFAVAGPRDPALAIAGAGIAAAALWSLRAAWMWAKGQEALGLGDVKMLAGIGAFIGPYALPEVVFWAAIAGIAMALVMSLRGPRDPELPFGAAMSLSAWLYLTCGSILFAT